LIHILGMRLPLFPRYSCRPESALYKASCFKMPTPSMERESMKSPSTLWFRCGREDWSVCRRFSDSATSQSQRTVCSEQLGVVRLRWLPKRLTPKPDKRSTGPVNARFSDRTSTWHVKVGTASAALRVARPPTWRVPSVVFLLWPCPFR